MEKEEVANWAVAQQVQELKQQVVAARSEVARLQTQLARQRSDALFEAWSQVSLAQRCLSRAGQVT